MTAPMTRERLAELRDAYRHEALSDLDIAPVDAEDLRELLSACEALLTERESVRDSALEEVAVILEADAAVADAKVGRLRAMKNDLWTLRNHEAIALRNEARAIRALKGKR